MNPVEKLLAAISFCILFALGAQAQDTIVKTNGEELSVKVFDVNEQFIRFKRVENLKGATQQIARTQVALIKYANGVREVINTPGTVEPPVRAATPQDSAKPQQQRVLPPDQRITEENGRYYYQGSRIGIRQISRLIEESGNSKAIMELKMYRRVSRRGKALLATGISLASVGIPVFLLSTVIKSDIRPNHYAYEFFTGTQVMGGLLGVAGVGCFIGGISNKNQAALTLEHTIETYNAGIK